MFLPAIPYGALAVVGLAISHLEKFLPCPSTISLWSKVISQDSGSILMDPYDFVELKLMSIVLLYCVEGHMNIICQIFKIGILLVNHICHTIKGHLDFITSFDLCSHLFLLHPEYTSWNLSLNYAFLQTEKIERPIMPMMFYHI